MSEQALTLSEAAIALHEFFISLLSAGFSPDQAIYLVGEIVATQAQGAEYYDD